jgi:hypothetical protein
MRPSLSIARMPVSMEFSMARRKLVSCTRVFWIWARRRMCIQVPNNIHTVSTDSDTTIQNKVLPTRPAEVSRPWPRSIKSLPAGDSGRSVLMVGRLCSWPGICSTVPATSVPVPSITAIACRRVTSAGTAWRSSGSTANSASVMPAKLPLRYSGT